MSQAWAFTLRPLSGSVTDVPSHAVALLRRHFPDLEEADLAPNDRRLAYLLTASPPTQRACRAQAVALVSRVPAHASLVPDAGADVLHLEYLASHGQGAGRQTLRQLLRTLGRSHILTLEVWRSTQYAVALFRSMGFHLSEHPVHPHLYRGVHFPPMSA